MKSRDKIPKHLPCHTCLVLPMCFEKAWFYLFVNCPILEKWHLETMRKKEEENRKNA